SLEILVFEEFIPNCLRRNDQTTFKDSLQVCKLETIARQANGEFEAIQIMKCKKNLFINLSFETMKFFTLIVLLLIIFFTENSWNHQRKSRKRIRVGARLFKCSRGDPILTQQLIFKQRILIKRARVSAGLTGSRVTKNYIF
ncbi:hypothetical protein ALC62_03440, partial [Cyphomyrmex costatus]